MQESWSELQNWFHAAQRPLPWRRERSPYAVWVSEVMLQQTQVSVVIPYFERWMQLFPTLEKLAAASSERVLKAWEGLGYYSRVRYLHAAAKQVVTEYGGEIPEEEAILKQIKGLGPYTIGAIRAFAFQRKATAVDGNVMRVLARFWEIEEDFSKSPSLNRLRERLQAALPDHQPWVVMEALIELGATICLRQPCCERCPLRKHCKAYQSGKQAILPYRSAKIAYQKLERTVLLIEFEKQLMVRCVEAGQVMHGLHEFPYLSDSVSEPVETTLKRLHKQGLQEISFLKHLPRMQHSFTRYRVSLRPLHLCAKNSKLLAGYRWEPITQLKNYAFSAGHRRIMQHFVGG